MIAAIRALLAMVPAWRHWQCAHGGRTCWECRAYAGWLDRARGAGALR